MKSQPQSQSYERRKWICWPVHAACGQVRTAASIERMTFASRSPITRNFVLKHSG